MVKPQTLIISPALAKANNGNWQTAARWSRFLRGRYRVSCTGWSEGVCRSAQPDVLIALHARRSAAAVTEFHEAFPDRPLVLVLTGTDLYRDIRTDPQAQSSLDAASHLVVLQSAGCDELSLSHQEKTTVIYQSAPTLTPPARPLHRRQFKVTMIGHLRAEKDPATFMRAISSLHDVRIAATHIGGGLDDKLAQLALTTMRSTPAYRWLGNLPHAATRQHLKRNDLMVISSVMEGGANVIIEAVTSGVAVIGSDIPGNRGMLGDDYAGYFPVGDAPALAALIRHAAQSPTFLARLQAQCARRALLFTPEREKAALLHLIDNCVLFADTTAR